MAPSPVTLPASRPGANPLPMTRQTEANGDPDLVVQIRKKLAGGFTLEAGFQAQAGVTILFGPSGSGKTTLLHCIAGLHRPDAGRVALGRRVLFDSGRGINVPVPRRSVGYLFQDLALFPHLTVEQNVRYGLARVPARARGARVDGILESLRIAHLRDRKPGAISGGERQRAALARSLVTDPAVLLLDEPLSALDGATKSKIIEDLRAWNAARGIPILYVTHSPAEAFALGERVIVLDSGAILAQGTPQQVLREPRHETVAQLAGFENIFDATVAAVSEDQGTMRCRLKGSEVELEVPLIWTEVGSPVRVAIRAGDIMLAATRPEGLSARNTFQGKLNSLSRQGVTVIATVEAGVKFEVHVTPGACQTLGLRAGRPVWLVIKTYSCHLVEPAPAGSD
ncbi:MAG TPA: molybdenum ABC transporter ATP-binding protein [Terriglobia bacterium]|nr:molybdenum ABC transporter ATP-binding protein [Terriglobia bacterium]